MMGVSGGKVNKRRITPMGPAPKFWFFIFLVDLESSVPDAQDLLLCSNFWSSPPEVSPDAVKMLHSVNWVAGPACLILYY